MSVLSGIFFWLNLINVLLAITGLIIDGHMKDDLQCSFPDGNFTLHDWIFTGSQTSLWLIICPFILLGVCNACNSIEERDGRRTPSTNIDATNNAWNACWFMVYSSFDLVWCIIGSILYFSFCFDSSLIIILILLIWKYITFGVIIIVSLICLICGLCRELNGHHNHRHTDGILLQPLTQQNVV
uniref:Uncharacterized protein n=1 Tax=viral metagenome TaxID=1070528 RepID=A0A6C0EFL6_9ZZZZ